MQRALVVRPASLAAGSSLLRASIMSHVTDAFFTFLLKESIIQLMVLMAAMFFIFFGFPIQWCISTIPLVAALVFLSTYSYHLMKAVELSTVEPLGCWIAEAFEPYLMTTDPQDINYTILNEAEYKMYESKLSSLQRKVVGIVLVRDFRGPVHSLWLYGLAVDPKYQRKKLGSILIKNAYDFCKQRGYKSLELVISDLQNEARLFFVQSGFKLTHIYHKRLLGIVPLGKFQMSVMT